MRRIGLLVVMLVLFAQFPAAARDMNGKFGVGYEQSLGGVSGLEVRYFISDFAISGIVGFDLFKPSNSDPRTAVQFAVGTIYNFARFEIVNLGIGVRAGAGWKNGDAVTAERKRDAGCKGSDPCPVVQPAGNVWQVNVEIPLMAELFFTDHFSIHLATGILFTILTHESTVMKQTGTGGVVPESGEKGFGFGIGNGSLFGSAGFTVYF
jgi:hypothetical protein